MKKVAAVLLVMVMAGCSSMGMSSSGRSGMSNMGSGMSGSTGPSVNQNPVINSNGGLNLYHGG